MWKKLLILSLSVTVLLFLAAPISIVDAGGKSKKINWRVAGTIAKVQSWGQDNNDQCLLQLKAKGAPGRADITIMGYADPEDALVPPNARTGCFVEIPFNELYFVAVFDDLSMLFAELGGEAYLCIGTDGRTIEVELNITGGTGRFDGAAGSFEGSLVQYADEYLEGALYAESGKFSGEIDFDD